MKIRIILAHVRKGFDSETREETFLIYLRRHGHDVMAYGICENGFVERDQPNIKLFSNDLREDIGHHAAYSRELIRTLRCDSADIIIVKGADYRIVHSSIKCAKRNTVIVSIFGGTISHRRHDARIHIALEEFENQIETVRKNYTRLIISFLFPKMVKWDLVNDRYNENKIYDAINVGRFQKGKRQDLACPLAHDWQICFVGDGPERAHVEQVAEGASIQPVFLGNIPDSRTYEAIKRSKIMVHTSEFEGFPRVFAESLALGVPIVARRSTFKHLKPIPGIVLADDDEIISIADRILRNGDELARLSILARQSGERSSSSALEQSFDAFIRCVEEIRVVYDPTFKERISSLAESVIDSWRRYKSAR